MGIHMIHIFLSSLVTVMLIGEERALKICLKVIVSIKTVITG